MAVRVDWRELSRYVVRIDQTDGAALLGTGFFVAPGWVLTAAHVVAAHNKVSVMPHPLIADAAVPARIVARSGPPNDTVLWPFPDLALLRLDGGSVSHPCVLLEAGNPAGDCYAWGFPPREYGAPPPGSPATFVFEGPDGDGFLRLKAGHAAPGLSGAPLLCPVRGAVVGVVTGSRDINSSMGGWASPVAALLAGGPGVPADLATYGKLISGDNASAVDLASWRNVLSVDGPSDTALEWEAKLRHDGISVWTDRDVRAGCASAEDTDAIAPVEPGETVDVTLLRHGRLPNLQRDFALLGEVVDKWLVAGHRKRVTDRLRVLWLVGQPGPHRSKGLLACLARAGMKGRVVYDADHNLLLAAKAIERAMDRPGVRLLGESVIGLDLPEVQSAADWTQLRDAIVRVRRQPAHDPYPFLVVAGTADQEQLAYDALKALIEIDPVDTRGRPHQRPYSDTGALAMVTASLSSEHVYSRGLPETSRELIGRADELTALHRAWNSERTRVASIVAYGGTGKSALVNTWLRNMRERDYAGADRVYAWSFYSQGTKDNLVSADPFVSHILSWLGDDSSVATLNPWAKGLRLASLIKKHNFLLVLDGMEPLQHPLKAPDVGGQLTDDSIRALLEELTKPDWNGLCVITTRVPLTDLDRFARTDHKQASTTVIRWNLDNLDDQAGAQLLARLVGDKATFRERQQAVQEVAGHALAVTLLGSYLRDVHGGDLAGRFDLEKLTVEVAEGGHARRIMASYVKWLERYERLAELAVLRLIGLFDRPATPEAMDALLANHELGPAMLELGHVGSNEWNRCVEALRGMGLLNDEAPNMPGTLDAHPLIREHFRDLLRKDGAAWQKGNQTLFDYYLGVALHQPADPQEMNKLYAAVGHGCAAGLHQVAFDHVLLTRVWRDRRTSFSTRRLGMTGSDLVALSSYFKHRWTQLTDLSLPSRARVLVLTNAGVRLRQLGRLVEARGCFGAVVSEIDLQTAEPEEMEDASYAAAQYCELLVVAGKLISRAGGGPDSALDSGQRAVEYADRGGDPYFSMHARSSLAEVYFMLGQSERAAALFEDAMAIDRERHPEPPFLYSQSLFRYGYYLIEASRAEELLADETNNPDWGTSRHDNSLLSSAIRPLILGAASRSLIERGDRSPERLAQAHGYLNDAINRLRTAGYADYTARGLLERAHFYRIRHQDDDYARAREDLDRAAIEADRGQMELLYADILLQQVACHREFRRVMSNLERSTSRPRIAHMLSEATDRIVTMGYARRRSLLDELRNDLL